MPKIQLGSPPASFSHPVSFELLDGTTAEITVTFRYRSRSEFSAFIDELYPRNPVEQLEHPASENLQSAAGRGIDRDVRHILGVAVGWDLEDNFDADGVRLLADRYPAAISAIVDFYGKAITEGRVKN